MTNFKEVADRITALQEKKNKDYGDAFVNLCKEWDSTALMYPLSIKMQRLKTLFDGGNQEVKSEALTDTLLDIMGYAGMGIMALENGHIENPSDTTLKGWGEFDLQEDTARDFISRLGLTREHAESSNELLEEMKKSFHLDRTADILAAVAQSIANSRLKVEHFDTTKLRDSLIEANKILQDKIVHPKGTWQCLDSGFSYKAGDIITESKPKRGKLILLVGNKGVGKTTYKNIICEKHPEEYQAPVSATTRKPREGEVHGKDYYFIDEMEFETALEMNLIIEAEIIQGNLYGSVKASIDTILGAGKNAITEIGLEGADDLRDIYGDDCEVYYIYNNEKAIAKQLIERDTSGMSAFFMMKGFDKFHDEAEELCDFAYYIDEYVPHSDSASAEDIAEALYYYIKD